MSIDEQEFLSGLVAVQFVIIPVLFTPKRAYLFAQEDKASIRTTHLLSRQDFQNVKIPDLIMGIGKLEKDQFKTLWSIVLSI